MTLEIRPTDDPDRFSLHDGDDRIGEIRNVPLDEEGIALGEPPEWNVLLWSVMGTGKEWGGTTESRDEAEQYASELFEEFRAERRELSTGPRPRGISTPMGGQKRK
ncbi:hypothetical protein ACWD3J_13685 [Streptomyces sp. NPDC002755]